MGLLDIPWLTDALKKRALRYLLQRYMGHFLAEKLTLEQLSLDLYDGTGCIKDLALDVEGLNEELLFLPFQFTSGCGIREINCSVPWSSLTTESCSLEISGATFHLNFCSSKDHDEDHLIESSYLSKSMMSSSMQMAEEIACEDRNNEGGSFEGLEMMAQLIDSVLRRVKVVATDTKIIMRSASLAAASANSYSAPCNNNPQSSPSSSNSPPSTFTTATTSESTESSVEFKIKYLRCEEDVLDASIGKDFKCNTPGNIDKLLTLEGVEVGINGRPVSRIGGKHLIKIKANAEKSDLQIFMGSPLLAVLTSSELKSFFHVFSSPPSPVSTQASPSHGYGTGSDRRFGSKPMTEEHFFQLENIMQQDAQSIRRQATGNPLHHPHQNQPLVGNSVHGNRWTDAASTTDRQFHPLVESLTFDDYSDSRSRSRSRSQSNADSSTGSGGNNFSCFIKIPGVYLCLLQKSDQSHLPAPTIPLVQVDFQKINSFLDDIVKDRNHMRLIAFPIHLDINKNSSINFIIGDAMVVEQSARSKVPLFWSESSDKHLTSPKYRCEIRPSSSPAVLIEGNETTCLTLDPTLIERLHEYISDPSDTRNSSSHPSQRLSGAPSPALLDLELRSKLLKVNLLFPVPDLRKLQPFDPEDDDDDDENFDADKRVTALRSEAVMFVLEEVCVTTDFRQTKAVFDECKAILTEKDREPVLFLHAKRNPVDAIVVVLTQGPSSVSVNDDNDPESYLSGEMGDSIYYSNLSQQDERTSAFMEKKKLINSGSSEKDSVVTPSDRKNAHAFLSQARACTGLQIEIDIPAGDLALDQRQLNILYNRFSNDLVLWSPKDRRQNNPQSSAAQSFPGTHVYKPCISAMADSTDSVESDSSFHSTDDVTGSALLKNACVVIMNVDELTIRALNAGSGDTNPDQKVKGQKVSLGVVVGLEEEKKSVIFLNGEKASFSNGNDVVIESNSFGDGLAIVNLTFEIRKEAKDFKKMKIAIEMEDAALIRTDVDVFKAFWNFINVSDELHSHRMDRSCVIVGYVPPSVTTELHISLLKGAITFNATELRPALITFDHIYMTSMVVQSNCETLLRIILEEGSLFFAKSLKQPLPSMTRPRSLRDYVCILDSGLTDLSITIKDDGRMELKISNNVINMRVCSDSLSALCQLVMHLANPTSSSSSTGSTGAPGPHTSSSLESLVEHQSGGDDENSESYKSLENREEDLLRDAIDECDLDSKDNVSLKSCENCDATVRSSIDESGFWILGDDDVGAGITASAEPTVRPLTSEPIMLKENHFTATRCRPLPEILKETAQRFLLEKLTIICNFYGGKDFNDETYDSSLDLLMKEGTIGREDRDQDDSIGSSKGAFPKDRENAKGLRVTFKDDPDCEPQVNLWESLNLVSGLDSASGFAASHGSAGGKGSDHFRGRKSFGSGSGSSKSGKDYAMEGGKGRQNEICVQLYLSKIKSLFETFDPSFRVSWRFVFLVQDIEVKDKVSHSLINKMLYEYCNESMPRRNHVNMISVRATCKKNPDDNNDECDIKVSAKPLRVNVDQDTLMFLIDFFTSINPSGRSASATSLLQTSSPANMSQTSLDKISAGDMSSSPNLSSAGSREEVREGNFPDEEADLLMGNTAGRGGAASVQSPRGSRKGSVSSVSKPPLLYVKTFIFSPDVPIRLDYHGKRMDFEKGALAGILMGLAQLNQSELRLKRLYNKHGMLGIDRVLLYAVQEWTRDIKRNQLPSLLGGVGPMHSVIQLFAGIRDLVWMPIDQYRRDKRLVRGFQRGASSFSSSTAMALIDLTNRVVNLIQNTAQFAHDVVSVPHHPIRSHHHASQSGGSGSGGVTGIGGNTIGNQQPRDLREGMTTAYAVMKDGLKDGFKENFRHVTQAEDVTGAIGAVVRELPSGIFLPFIHLTQASSNVLVGIRNQIAPDARKEDQDKYKS